MIVKPDYGVSDECSGHYRLRCQLGDIGHGKAFGFEEANPTGFG